jgi:hypothetical protein
MVEICQDTMQQSRCYYKKTSSDYAVALFRIRVWSYENAAVCVGVGASRAKLDLLALSLEESLNRLTSMIRYRVLWW